MIKLLRFFLILFLPATITAQKFGNEWINYNQQYLKIPINTTGMYQIDHSTLSAALAGIGADLSTINPNAFQLISKGEEQPIDIEGGADGSFDTGDKLLFFGEGNDGWFDAFLYQDPNGSRMNPYYSLYSDTLYYYLTWNTFAANFRYKLSSNTNFVNKTSESYFTAKSISNFNNTYNYGSKDNAGVSSPIYHPAEGYASPLIRTPSKRSLNVTTRNIYQATGAPSTIFKTTFSGASNASGSPNHRMEVKVGTNQVIDTSFTGYDLIEKTILLNSTSLNATTQRVEFGNLPLTPAPATDFLHAGYASFEYPHSTNMGSEPIIEMWVPSSTDTLYYSLTNYSYGAVPFVYDLEKGIKCQTIQSGKDIQFLIAPGNSRRCIIVGTSRFTTISDIKPINNISNNRGEFTDYASLVGDSAFLIVTHKSLWSAATQYANYKSQKGFDVQIVSIEDLYDQFAYGIYQHSLAIKNYTDFLLDNKKSAPPQYLFLAGKSVKTISTRKNTSNRSKNKVPTIGTPPADNLFAGSLKGDETQPKLSVGRIAASNQTQLLNYLEKVREHDAQQDVQSMKINEAIWKKRGVHFAGGANDFEQQVFSIYLDGYARSFESGKMGGVVHTYKRFSSGTSESIAFDTVSLLINNGVSILSFFGHGSNGQLGINLGEPTDYNNTGKYPLFIANSCNVGDFHLPNEDAVSVNEKWMLTKNKGAIGFIASTSIGYTSTLNRYTSGFYRALSDDRYGKSIGKVMQSAAAGMNANIEFDLRTALEMNLHGDPSLVLNPVEKPDFAIEKEFISAPEIVSADKSTFQLEVMVYNLGQTSDSTINVHLEWRYPNGRDTSFIKQFTDRAYTNKVVFDLPIDEDNAIGENNFTIRVNPELVVDEIYPTENNVVSGIRVNITSDDLIPIWPKNYAIVPSSEITFAASTADLFAPEREYVFELDINAEFNSPMKKTTTVKSKGGVIEWKPYIAHAPDSVVYYWRCSPKKANTADFKWRMHSFQIIPGKEGWSQYDFSQFSLNKFSSIEYLKNKQTFGLLNGKVAIAATTKGSPALTVEDISATNWSRNGDIQGRAGYCAGRPSILISVIDPKTAEPWESRHIDNSVTPPITLNPTRNYGNWNDPSRSGCATPDKKFMYRVHNAQEMDSMIRFINYHIPDSFYILVSTRGIVEFRDTCLWKERHIKLFEDLGSDSIRSIKSNYPWLFFTQKGNPSKTVEVVGEQPTELVSLRASIEAGVGSGIMESVIIGPTTKWEHLSWSHSSNSANDSMKLEVSGIDEEGIEDDIVNLKGTKKEMADLEVNYDDFEDFHYIKLKAEFFDQTDFVPPHLNKWQLYYKESPEFAYNQGRLFNFHNDSVLQGEAVTIETEIKNASRIDAPSLLVRGYLRGEKNDLIELPIKSIENLKALEGRVDSFIVNTAKLGGLYTLTLELNPLDTNWQPEAAHFNNLMR